MDYRQPTHEVSSDCMFDRYLVIKHAFYAKCWATLMADLRSVADHSLQSALESTNTPLTADTLADITRLEKVVVDNLQAAVGTLRYKQDKVDLVPMKEIEVHFAELREFIKKNSDQFWQKKFGYYKYAQLAKQPVSSERNGKVEEVKEQQNKDNILFFGDFDKNPKHSTSVNGFQGTDYSSKRHLFIRLPLRAQYIFKQWVYDHPDDPHPSKEEREMLASRTGVTPKQVGYWFVNNRAKRPSKGTRSAMFINSIRSKLFHQSINNNKTPDNSGPTKVAVHFDGELRTSLQPVDTLQDDLFGQPLDTEYSQYNG